MTSDPGAPRVRTIRRPCRACGAPVPFRVWRGFAAVAQHLASMCPECHCVSVLRGPDSWHKRHSAAAQYPIQPG